MGQPKIFVSHSHNDDAFTERLVEDLRQAGADAWMDKTDLGAGNFQQRISEALADCEWFVLVLTRDALASPWVRQEVDAANRLKNQGQVHNLIFIQAGPLEHREVPALWGVFNIFDATADYAFARNRALTAVGLPPSLKVSPPPSPSALPPLGPAPLPAGSTLALHLTPTALYRLGFRGYAQGGVECVLPPLCPVPGGIFMMGSEKARDQAAVDDETPQYPVDVAGFAIGQYPVTVAEYACYVRTGHTPPVRAYLNSTYTFYNPTWDQQLTKLDHPVVNVSWYDAIAYATWLAKLTGQLWSLSTEAEWEKAARWDPQAGVCYVYPWGDASDQARCNTRDSGLNITTPVGTYPSGASPCGAQDMAGNVWEWTSSLYQPYPYTRADGREVQHSTGNRVLRGGSWLNDAMNARAAGRLGDGPETVSYIISGFRLVVGAPAGS